MACTFTFKYYYSYKSLPKFKDHFPKFSGNNTIYTKEHLIAFCNACHKIGANDNDTCMGLFVYYLEGKIVAYLFELSPKVFSTWDDLTYWLKSTYGQPKNPIDQLQEYNNTVYNNGETINLSIFVSPNYIIKFLN
jgi:hypothetical protein